MADLITTTQSSSRHVISVIYGSALAKELIEVTHDETRACRVTGYVSHPNFNTKRLTFILFINRTLFFLFSCHYVSHDDVIHRETRGTQNSQKGPGRTLRLVLTKGKSSLCLSEFGNESRTRGCKRTSDETRGMTSVTYNGPLLMTSHRFIS